MTILPPCRPAAVSTKTITADVIAHGKDEKNNPFLNLPHISSCYLRLFPVLASSKHFASKFRGKFFGHLTGSLHNIHLRWPCLRRFKTLGNFGDGVDAKHIWRNREPPLLQCSGCPRHVMVFCLCSNRDQTFLYMSSSYSSIRLTQTPKHCARFRPEKAKGSSMISNYDE